jgi:hypothetical protein
MPGKAVKVPGEAVKVGGEGEPGCCRWSGKVTGKGAAVVGVCTGEETAGKKFTTGVSQGSGENLIRSANGPLKVAKYSSRVASNSP